MHLEAWRKVVRLLGEIDATSDRISPDPARREAAAPNALAALQVDRAPGVGLSAGQEPVTRTPRYPRMPWSVRVRQQPLAELTPRAG